MKINIPVILAIFVATIFLVIRSEASNSDNSLKNEDNDLLPVHHDSAIKENRLSSHAISRFYSDGSHQIQHRNGTKETLPNGNIIYADKIGRITSQIRGDTRTQFQEDGSRIIQVGNRKFLENSKILDNGEVLVERKYVWQSNVIHRTIQMDYQYRSSPCHYWRHSEPLIAYSSNLALTEQDYTFLKSPLDLTSPRPGYTPSAWGWKYWNTYSWPGYGWWQYFTKSYWRPWGYFRSESSTIHAILDFILASTYELAWETRLERKRWEIQREYEDLILSAEDEMEIALLQVKSDLAVSEGVAEEIKRAKAEAESTAKARIGGIPLNAEIQEELALQIDRIILDRLKGNSNTRTFDNAIETGQFFYLLSFNPEIIFDGEKGPCALYIGDLLYKPYIVPNTETVRLEVRQAQPSSCGPGTRVFINLHQLRQIYNAFEEMLDTGIAIYKRI